MIVDRLSIRVRITIGTLVLAGAFFGGASILVHREVESVLDNASAAVLDSDASPYVIALRDEPDDAIDSPGDDQLIAVVDPESTIALSTLPDSLASEFDRIDLRRSSVQEVRAKGTDYLVLVKRQSTPSGTWAVVAARTETTSRLVLDSLTRGLFWGLAALTVIFGAASWFLSGAALRPIVRLRRSAEALVGANTSELLPEAGPRDEVHDLAATLNTLIEQLRESAEREKQMVSDASHELRTPLAALQGQLELIRRGDKQTTDADIAAAEAAASRMADLVANLLELSRLDSTGARDSATISELRSELVEAVDRARFAVRATGVAVEYEFFGDELDAASTVRLSAHDFGRIVDNLASNAAHALGDVGTVDVTLSVNSGDIVLEVVDDGPGMSADFVGRAFDRFSQQDDGRSGGTGLGLSIVAAAARHAGGTVRLQNRESGGLRVVVTIPLARD